MKSGQKEQKDLHSFSLSLLLLLKSIFFEREEERNYFLFPTFQAHLLLFCSLTLHHHFPDEKTEASKSKQP